MKKSQKCMLSAIVLVLSLIFFSEKALAQAELWGMTTEGGDENLGVIFKTDESGNNYNVLKSFGLVNPGYVMGTTNLFKASNGKVYGTTQGGGKYTFGVLFKYDPSTNAYTKLYDFNDTLGSSPRGTLMEASNGKLYGTTAQGGKKFGVIFEFDPSNETVKMRYAFNDTLGSVPGGSLVEASNGKLYGLANGGGANKGGVLFEFDPATGAYATKVDFQAKVPTNTTGSMPFGSLLYASNGKLYGMTYYGGTQSGGVLFEYDITNATYTVRHNFQQSKGCKSYGDLIEYSQGKFYGMTREGGAKDKGVIFEYDLSNTTYTVKMDFNGSNGEYPSGNLLKASNGKLYSMTLSGGANFSGVLFEFDPATLKCVVLKDFKLNNQSEGRGNNGFLSEPVNGKLYALGRDGGSYRGTIFQYDLGLDSFMKKLDFDVPAFGTKPYGSLVRAANGKLYGSTRMGGTNNTGAFFEYDIASGTYSKVLDYDNNSIFPYAETYVSAENGMLYGVAGNKIFEFNPDSNRSVQKCVFNGNVPNAMINGPDGKLYGVSASAGTYGMGFVYSYKPGSTKIDMIYIFGPSGISNPEGELMLASNGLMYGVAMKGGSAGYGGIFSITSGGGYNLIAEFDGTAGKGSATKLAEGPNGELYGMSIINTSFGVLYQCVPSSGKITKKADLYSGALGSLMNASNGKIYGLVRQGSTKGFGWMFEYDPSNNKVTEKLAFNGSNGRYPYYTRILEVCYTPALGAISGNAEVCGDGSPNVYTVPTNAGVNSYFWTVPMGASIVSGQNTNTITVSFSGPVSGKITVEGVNECKGPASGFEVKATLSQVGWDVKAGQVLQIGTPFVIKTSNLSAGCHKALYFSSDSGKTWLLLKDSLTSADENINWKVADAESVNCFFKVTGVNAGKEWKSPRFTIFTPMPYKAIDFVGEYNTIKTNGANPNNAAEPGYPLRFKLQIANNKPINLLTLKGTLQSKDPYIVITDSLGTYNNIIAGKKGWSVDEYEIYILPTCPDNHILTFDLKVTDEIDAEDPWTSRQKINFPVNVMDIPVIVIDDDNIPDSKGNDNDVAEKDEIIEILPLLRNKSSYTFDKPEGWLTSPDNYIDIWDGRTGATGTVYNTYKYNSAGGNHQPLQPLANNVTPEEDFVFDYLAPNAYSLDFRMLMDCYLVNFKVEDPNSGGMVAPRIRYGLPYGLNKGYPKPISVDITSPDDGKNFGIGSMIGIEATVSSSVALDSVKLYINDQLTDNSTQSAYTYLWNTSGKPTGVYVIKVEALDVNGNRASDVIVINLDNSVGIGSAPVEGNLRIYPNPGSGLFYIDGLMENTYAQIFDLNGRQVYSLNLQPGKGVALDASSLQQGSYILRLTGASGKPNQYKLIITKDK